MVTRRPIPAHPLFARLIALWCAALLGLTVTVLPARSLEPALTGVGLDGLVPLSLATRAMVALVAATVGALVGYAAARRIAQHTGRDPRPIYAEAVAEPDAPVEEPQRRRPLHIREELEDGFGDESQLVSPPPRILATFPEAQEGFMILTPQPIHPPQPEPDLQALLAQFDTAFAAFHDDEDRAGFGAGPSRVADPVRSFVARQTGASSSTTISSPIGGLVPDHQAELRAALDKLARSQETI